MMHVLNDVYVQELCKGRGSQMQMKASADMSIRHEIAIDITITIIQFIKMLSCTFLGARAMEV